MMKVSVQSIHFHADAKLIAFVEKKLAKLSRYFDQSRTIEAEVFLKLQDTGGRVQEKITEVKIHFPPGSWMVDKKTGRTFEAAITASADTLKRQLLRHKERSMPSRGVEFAP